MSALTDLIGQELGPTEWLVVDQARIDEFARATDDPQWIHVDPERAAQGPFGTTIAHGYLTLSLCVPLMGQALTLSGYRMGINYGVNRVRFPAPLPSGSRVQSWSVTDRVFCSAVATAPSPSCCVFSSVAIASPIQRNLRCRHSRIRWARSTTRITA